MFGIFSAEVEFLIVVLGIVIVICLLMFACAIAYFCLVRKFGGVSENPWDRRKVTLRKYRLLQTIPPRPSSVCLANELVYKWPWENGFGRSGNGCNYMTLEGSCYSDHPADDHYFRPPYSPTPSDEGAYKTPLHEGHYRCVTTTQQQPSSSRPPVPSTSKAQQLSRAPLAQWSTKPPIGDPSDIYVQSGSPSVSATPTKKGDKERKHRKKHRDGSDTTDSDAKLDRRVHKKRRRSKQHSTDPAVVH